LKIKASSEETWLKAARGGPGSPGAPLPAQREPGLLGGVVVMRGTFASGARLTAIPNYARRNRDGTSLVWLRDR
jgi:hypothetical protein